MPNKAQKDGTAVHTCLWHPLFSAANPWKGIENPDLNADEYCPVVKAEQLGVHNTSPPMLPAIPVNIK
jgi:hypothetical protein